MEIWKVASEELGKRLPPIELVGGSFFINKQSAKWDKLHQGFGVKGHQSHERKLLQ